LPDLPDGEDGAVTAGPWARFDDLQAGDAIMFPIVDR
jgi:hypothetical protein